MSTDIIAITNEAGVTLESASFFNRDCHFPITDLIRRCPPDEVMANIPTMLGSWADDTVAPSITDYDDIIDYVTNAADECRAAIVRSTMTTCELIVPNQVCMTLETPELNWKDLFTRFCRSRNIRPGAMCVFNPDGSLAIGEPYTVDFIRFSLTTLSRAMAKIITRNTLIGDDANADQFDGIHTQLINGWNPTTNTANPTCGDEFDIATTIDWNTLTGGTVGGCASPDDETIADQTLTVWGEDCAIPAGLNLAEFLEDFWIEKVQVEWANAFGGVDAWEAHIQHGQAKCLINTAACMQPCGLDASNILDPGLRERFRRLRLTNMVELYPSGTVFPMLQSRYVAANTMWFGPRSIGGNPTYGMFFENMDEYLAQLSGVGGLYGSGRGMIPPTKDMLLPVTQDFLNFGFEDAAIFWDLFKETAFCVRASMMACAGVLTCARHLWLRVQNVCCESTCITQCDERLTLTT
jgi:hypothetical protein